MTLNPRTPHSLVKSLTLLHGAFPSVFQAQRAIREVDGKRLVTQWLPKAWEQVNTDFSDASSLDGLRAQKAFGVSPVDGVINWDALAVAYVTHHIMLRHPRSPSTAAAVDSQLSCCRMDEASSSHLLGGLASWG
jgi:hypothetical protein